jgi:hypothetical protein
MSWFIIQFFWLQGLISFVVDCGYYTGDPTIRHLNNGTWIVAQARERLAIGLLSTIQTVAVFGPSLCLLFL